MSKKFNEYKILDLPKVSAEILNFWKNENIFEQSLKSREGNTAFVFFEGPPSANGLPGIHHVMGRTIKDIFCRYKTQKGFYVERKAGWDTHGLPVELGVEKELGITKEDIGKTISIEDYNNACKKTVMRYTDIWNDLTEKMGYWVDMTNPYVTYKAKYIESVWWLLKQIYNKNLIYKGYTVQPYSPKAGTALSSHEVNQPGTYKEITDTTVVAQFKAINETLPNFLQDFGDIHFLAWTTTPWTLSSNTALAVGPKIDYVLVRTFNPYTYLPINVILAKNLVSKYFNINEKEWEFHISNEIANKQIWTEIIIRWLNDGNNLDVINQDNRGNEFETFTKKKALPYKIIKEFKGVDLVEIRYEQLLNWVKPHQNPENAFRVILGDFVSTEEGTGIVHIAPTFGADDAKVAKEAIPEVPSMLILDDNGNPVPLVDLQGKFRPEMGKYAGKYVKNEYYDDGKAPEKSVDVELAIKLKEENKAFKVEKYTHSYPHCWRTDKPILYYPIDSWFIKITEVRDRMFDLNETINWKPKATGEGRFGNWLKNANDWNLSRSRYWGIPLPIWRTEDGLEELIIGSIEELHHEIEKSVTAGLQEENPFKTFKIGDLTDENYDLLDLHKNVVDKIILISPSQKPMTREKDLIDVWFDSGAMPYAQRHYPFNEKRLPPQADFIAEGVDQTRGWFYTLHAIGTLVFDRITYKNVVSNGLVLDKDGKKMSKRLGNAPDPFETLSKYGADATRWYMISNTNPWDNLKFDVEGITEVQRKFFGTLFNSYSFFALYANIDNFTYAEAEISMNERPEIDRWIISELNTLISQVDAAYEDYEPTKASRLIAEFVSENLSNWYIRLCRRRFWKGDYQHDKIAAYQTLYTCLLTISKLSAPIAPFFMDQLYKDLTQNIESEHHKSVHLSFFPNYVETFVDNSLEQRMKKAQTISSMVLSLRKKEMIKVRQPLQKIMIPVLNMEFKAEIEAIADLIKAEVNVKEIELIDDSSNILIKKIKPNFKSLGSRFGKDINLVVKEIQQLSQLQISDLDKHGKLNIKFNKKELILTTKDVEIFTQNIEGWLVANDNGITVALDITVSEQLKNEGIARELVNRIQNIRKNLNFLVTDKIKVFLEKNIIIENAVHSNLEYIKSETLAGNLSFKNEILNGFEIEFDNLKTKILIIK